VSSSPDGRSSDVKDGVVGVLLLAPDDPHSDDNDEGDPIGDANSATGEDVRPLSSILILAIRSSSPSTFHAGIMPTISVLHTLTTQRYSVNSSTTTRASPSSTFTNSLSVKCGGRRCDINEGEYESRAYDISVSGVMTVIVGIDPSRECEEMDDTVEDRQTEGVGVRSLSSSSSDKIVSKASKSMTGGSSPLDKSRNWEADIISRLLSSESRESESELTGLDSDLVESQSPAASLLPSIVVVFTVMKGS